MIALPTTVPAPRLRIATSSSGWHEGAHADDVDLGIEDDREDARADAEREGRGVQREFTQRPTHAAHPTLPRQEHHGRPVWAASQLR